MSKKHILTCFLILTFFSVISFGQKKLPNLFPIKLKSKIGYIDNTGKIIIEPKFDYGWKFSEGYACVVVNGKTGFIDESGRYLVKPQFNSAYGCYTEFSEGFASVSIGSLRKVEEKWIDERKWGFVNTKGKVMFLPGISYLSDFSEGLAFFKQGDLTGYVDKDFKVVIEPKFESAGDFYEGRARATGIDGSEYYIDKTGRRLFENRDGCDFQNGMACFSLKEKTGYINLDGKVVIEAKFDGGNYFADNGLAGVKIGDKWGFIDKKGKFAIAPQFDDVCEFSEGLASFEIDGKIGFIDESGAIVIPAQFDKGIYWFENGISEIKLDGKIGYIDKTGKFIWSPTD